MVNDVIIVGGGLAGLVNAIQLADRGLEVLVIEKKEYPFHRVCGEYISNEALPFLKSVGADPEILIPSYINQLAITSPSGTIMKLPLKMGGFGLSRFTFDNYLYTIALRKGVQFKLNTAVTNLHFENERFFVMLTSGEVEEAPIVIGSFGKRSNIDRHLNRNFFIKKSPYIGVKYHIITDFPENLITLHNFKNGYCGISKVEGGKFCLCYLTTKENLRNTGNIKIMEEEILCRNHYLKEIFKNSDFLYEKPEVINEISFGSKSIVDQHILMSGDAAGMITPLCGNGMAMAIHSAKILSHLISIHYKRTGFKRRLLEKQYEYEWKRMFQTRLLIGRQIQRLFGKESLTDFTIKVLKNNHSLGKWLVQKTHGEIF